MFPSSNTLESRSATTKRNVHSPPPNPLLSAHNSPAHSTPASSPCQPDPVDPRSRLMGGLQGRPERWERRTTREERRSARFERRDVTARLKDRRSLDTLRRGKGKNYVAQRRGREGRTCLFANTNTGTPFSSSSLSMVNSSVLEVCRRAVSEASIT